HTTCEMLPRSSRSTSSLSVKDGGAGETTAPNLITASNSSHNSTWSPSRTRIRSPGCTPWVQPVRHLVGTQGHVPVGVFVLVLLTDDPQCGSVGPGLGDLVEMIERPVERFRSWPGEQLVRG